MATTREIWFLESYWKVESRVFTTIEYIDTDRKP
jgi:hypothetical protein